MNQLLTAVILTISGIYIYLIWRSTYLGWLSILAVQFYEYSFGVEPVVVGELHLDAVDLVSIGLLVAGLLRTLPRLRERNTARVIGVGYLAIFASSLIRGFLANGFIPAANESRGFVPLLIALLYFLTAPADPALLRKYLSSYLYYGFGFVIVALLAYAGFHVGGVAWLHSSTQLSNTIEDRLLPAAAVLGVALGFILSLSWSRQRDPAKLSQWLPAVFLGAAIFLRHRSVWLVLISATITLFVTDRRLFRRLVSMAVFSLLVIAVFATVASLTAEVGGGASGAAEDTQEEFAYSASEAGTWQWRVDVWRSFVFGEDQTFETVLFGKGLGGGYVNLAPTSGHWEISPPHSEYVAQYSRVGLIGMCFLFWFLYRPIFRYWVLSTDEELEMDPPASTWIAVLVGTLVYGITYSISLDAFALVGIACAALARFDAPALVELKKLAPSQSPA
jgi:hypothetical protein